MRTAPALAVITAASLAVALCFLVLAPPADAQVGPGYLMGLRGGPQASPIGLPPMSMSVTAHDLDTGAPFPASVTRSARPVIAPPASSSRRPSSPCLTYAAPRPRRVCAFLGLVVPTGAETPIPTKAAWESGALTVPARSVFEAMGCGVGYADGRITVSRGDNTVAMMLGEPTFSVITPGNAYTRTFAVTPFKRGGSTYIELAQVVRALGWPVTVKEDTKTIAIGEDYVVRW